MVPDLGRASKSRGDLRSPEKSGTVLPEVPEDIPQEEDRACIRPCKAA